MGHLDRPMAQWPLAVTARPAEAMRLGEQHGRIAVGGAANLVIFRGRFYSEVLARPQLDRLVLRDGRPLTVEVPDYRELDRKKGSGSTAGGVKRARQTGGK